MLAMAPRHRELFFSAPWRRALPSELRFGVGTETSTRGACATRAPSGNVGRFCLTFLCCELLAHRGGQGGRSGHELVTKKIKK